MPELATGIPPTYAAFSNSCTLGQGSGARVLNGAQSASVIRLKIVSCTDGLAHTPPPVGDCGMLIPQAVKPQQFEAKNVWNDGDVRIGKDIAGKIRPATK